MNAGITRRARGPQAAPGPVDDAAETVTITEANAGDLAEIIDLDVKVVGYSRVEFWTDMFRREPANANQFLLVARNSDGVMVGYVLGEIRSWPVRAPVCGWLYTIGVEASHRLKKIATALMTELIARFRDNGVEAVRTVIDVDDHLLMSFLRAFGMSAGPFVELEMPVGQPCPKKAPVRA